MEIWSNLTTTLTGVGTKTVHLNTHTTTDQMVKGISLMNHNQSETFPKFLKKLKCYHLPLNQRLRIRFVLKGDPEPTVWGDWLISPVPGCWELADYGPFAIKNAQKCQILLQSVDEGDVDLLLEYGFYAKTRISLRSI